MKKNTQTSNWLDNYNDSEVNLPQGFVGEGTFNGPKFDNPAWGGQFQMGGNLPGAVGNMCARTGSPSKGPRRNQTDVTDASAQNGKEMQYYQQGLDWQPKTISKNGGWLDGYDVAQGGTNLPSVRDIITDTTNRKIQAHKGKGKETVVTKKDNTKTVTPKVDTTKPLTKEQVDARRLLEGLKQNISTDEETSLQERKNQAFKSMQEFYKSPLGSPGYFTPEGAIIGALQGVTKLGPDLYEGNYKGAAIDALMALPIGIPAAKGLGRVLGPEEGLIGKVNNFYNEYSPIAKEIITNPKIAIAETKQYIADKILDPIKYAGSRSKVKNIFNSKIKELNNPETFKRLETIGVDPQEFISNLKNTKLEFTNNGSSMVPKLTGNKSFLMFDQNQASKLRNDGYSLSDEAIIDHELGHLMQSNSGITSPTSLDRYSDKLLENTDKNILSSIGEDNLEYFTNAKKPNLSKQPTIGAEDWQKTERLPFLRETKRELIEKGFIKDINSPITPEVISNFSQTNSGNRIMSFINKGDYDFKTLSNLLNKTPVIIPGAIGLGAAATMQKQKEGGIIKDDRGQWGKHKGEPTRINQSEPGSYIDMGPDPLTGEPLTEPLLGISDKGEKKMMYPGEKHKFKKGTKYVDEYPKGKLAKNGLRQEQKGLQNIDNLVNFTNYNKPTIGGWLNKYKS